MKLLFSNRVSRLYQKLVEHSLHQLMQNHRVEHHPEFTLKVALDVEDTGDVPISDKFHQCLLNRDLCHDRIFDHEPLIRTRDGRADYLSTMAYMMNYLQEVSIRERDDLGRFPYRASYQHRFCVAGENLVLDYFRLWLREVAYPDTVKDQQSRIFISHDNDSLYSGLLQDGFHALKRGRIDWLLKILYQQLTGRPRWMNMDFMMDLNDAYGVKSTFFWLTNNARTTFGSRRYKNGDYNIYSRPIQRLMKEIEKRGFEQGLHKSLNPTSFSEEMNALPFEVLANRNHYLAFSIPAHFSEVDEAGLKLDFSLGFAEEFGLRNSYAMPVQPFVLDRESATNALFIPLMIMDTSNWTYKRKPLSIMKEEVLCLLEKHKKNALISVLWHNKYFTDMKYDGYLEVYEDILKYCQKENLEPIGQVELSQQFKRV